MSMFRELGKLMPWVEGEGGETHPSTEGDGNCVDLLGNSNGSNGSSTGNGGNGHGGNNNDGGSGSAGSGEGTGEDSGSSRASENFDQLGSRKHNTQKVLGRPTTEQLGQCFKRAKLSLKEDPFLNQDQVIGAGLAQKKNTTISFPGFDKN